MTISKCSEVVFDGFDNKPSITVYETLDDVKAPYDFLVPGNVTTRIVVEFKGTAVVADSDDSNIEIDWTQGGGVLVFDFSSLTIPAGRYKATLINYSPASPDGLVLLHYDTHGLRFRFL